MLSEGDLEKIAELRLDRLKVEGMVVGFNLKLIELLEESTTMTDKEKEYIARVLEV